MAKKIGDPEEEDDLQSQVDRVAGGQALVAGRKGWMKQGGKVAGQGSRVRCDAMRFNSLAPFRAGASQRFAANPQNKG